MIIGEGTVIRFKVVNGDLEAEVSHDGITWTSDGLRFAALGRDEILAAARFHMSAECLRQDLFNWLVAAYDKGAADARALMALEKSE
jgi:hypothetical protein